MDMGAHRASSKRKARTAHALGYLGINGASRYLDCSRSHLYAEIRRGRIPTRRLGSRIRIRIADLDAYLERGPG
jgi:excisionase family DNA binding protein